MKTELCVLFIGLLLILLMVILGLSGCTTLGNFLQGPEDETIAPTPGVMLWNAAKKSNWLVTGSILGIAAGVFALVNGSVKLGTASIASASVSLFMALAVSRFALWMAVFGLIGSVAAALFSILVRRKALVQIIKGVQLAKETYEFDNNTAPLKTELEKQSNTTKTIVNSIKNELKLAGQI